MAGRELEEVAPGRILNGKGKSMPTEDIGPNFPPLKEKPSEAFARESATASADTPTPTSKPQTQAYARALFKQLAKPFIAQRSDND
jgi:hypothetical protein